MWLSHHATPFDLHATGAARVTGRPAALFCFLHVSARREAVYPGPLTDDNSAGLSGWRVLSLSERGLGVMGPPSRPSLRCKWVQIPAPTAASPALGKGLPEITGKDGCAAESLKQVGAQKGM